MENLFELDVQVNAVSDVTVEYISGSFSSCFLPCNEA
ncbi:hypothetical protein EV586_104111 [Tumebacillus sp. BK434]|nr:FDLD family class I lanthipeptide [Tumebacillus sp. BK434]TCP54493.1 hypothetical protein EV586_104111 [Tumebacillus sp. BK434]